MLFNNLMNNKSSKNFLITVLLIISFVFTTGIFSFCINNGNINDIETDYSYTIVDTGQTKTFNNSISINPPSESSAFYGQDAQYTRYVPNYLDNDDGTITDLNTGLMWQKSTGDKMTWDEAKSGADSFNLAGYDDWRLPTIKELYSLILFSGLDPMVEGSGSDDLIPFIDTDYFDFEYGDVYGDRLIDSQYWSSTKYVSTTMNNNETAFGVNFADGRIKGYPTEPTGRGARQTEKTSFAKYVRGNTEYGINDFMDNNDGTITDEATGLMWMKTDSQSPMNWEDALSYAESLDYAEYTDWRLPNAKELQSIVDYTRSPHTTSSAAIDPMFEVTTITDEGDNTNYPFYWTSTTHESMAKEGENAVYIAFGEALGFMEVPPDSANYNLWDVHGAGAQRSDPKTGNPDDYPYGFGPQGDVIRIYNYVRCVRIID
jgi:hypothetical protein